MDNIYPELVYSHFWSICTRSRRQIGIIYRKFYGHTSSASLLQLCLTFVRPHLEYTQLQFGTPTNKVSRIHCMERLHKFALRICMRDWNADYVTLLESCNLPTLASRRHYLKLWFLYQIIWVWLPWCTHCQKESASKSEKQQCLYTSETFYLF